MGHAGLETLSNSNYETDNFDDDGAPVGAHGFREGADGAESLALVDSDLQFLIEGFPRLAASIQREILEIVRAELDGE